MAHLQAVARIHRYLQVARIHRYLKKHEGNYAQPVLREKLIADGYDPQIVDLAMAQAYEPRTVSKTAIRSSFGIAFVVGLVLNVLVYRYYPRYWVGMLLAELFAATGFVGAGAEPMVATRWSQWYTPGDDDASGVARMRRQAERGLMRGIGCGFTLGVVGAVLVVLLVSR